jgi:hypothetical protein
MIASEEKIFYLKEKLSVGVLGSQEFKSIQMESFGENFFETTEYLTTSVKLTKTSDILCFITCFAVDY